MQAIFYHVVWATDAATPWPKSRAHRAVILAMVSMIANTFGFFSYNNSNNK